MPLAVHTQDSNALADGDLDEMASMGGSFDIGTLSKAKEDWVLCTTAREGTKLQGFVFTTLERIGGTPCVLLGLGVLHTSAPAAELPEQDGRVTVFHRLQSATSSNHTRAHTHTNTK